MKKSIVISCVMALSLMIAVQDNKEIRFSILGGSYSTYADNLAPAWDLDRMHQLKELYPNATIYSILNDELGEVIHESMQTICDHYSVKVIKPLNIAKMTNHLSIAGMQTIYHAILDENSNDK